ncbi:MAG: hypothetical protein IKS42_00800 [Oscillospiraceae bacterium]|nr:hypothetical protein [Oscillospiraceae bacterium]
MKRTAIAAALIFAALLTGCGNTESSTTGIETTTSASDTTTAETTTTAAETTTTTAETEATASETTADTADTTASSADTTAAGAQQTEAQQTEAQQTGLPSGDSMEAMMERAKAKVLEKVGSGYRVLFAEELPHNPGDELVFVVSVVQNNDPDAQSQKYMANDRICMTQEEYAAQID